MKEDIVFYFTFFSSLEGEIRYFGISYCEILGFFTPNFFFVYSWGPIMSGVIVPSQEKGS